MGRIKSTYVKSSARKLYSKDLTGFSDNFDKNKETFAKLAKVPSKKMRNSVVGYITRLAKRASKEQ